MISEPKKRYIPKQRYKARSAFGMAPFSLLLFKKTKKKLVYIEDNRTFTQIKKLIKISHKCPIKKNRQL